MMKGRISVQKKYIISLAALIFVFAFTGCYSVFSGGTGGRLIDSESEEGISSLAVYAYTDKSKRDSDFSSWKEDSDFRPAQDSYYARTETNDSGEFTLSKIVWKSFQPQFGKDADYITVYLLFFNEKYGLQKGSTLLLSDSTGDTVFEKLTAVKKEATINFSFVDVATMANSTATISALIRVPQNTKEKIYTASMTSNGAVKILYPANKTPEITVTYLETSSEPTWKACYNDEEDAEKGFKFIPDSTVKFTLPLLPDRAEYSVSLYGKKCRFAVPAFTGQLIDTETNKDDGVKIILSSEGKEYGSTTTYATTYANTSEEKHGNYEFRNNWYWDCNDYEEQYAEKTFTLEAQVENVITTEYNYKSSDSSFTVNITR